jgi:hypothetical protein
MDVEVFSERADGQEGPYVGEDGVVGSFLDVIKLLYHPKTSSFCESRFLVRFPRVLGFVRVEPDEFKEMPWKRRTGHFIRGLGS